MCLSQNLARVHDLVFAKAVLEAGRAVVDSCLSIQARAEQDWAQIEIWGRTPNAGVLGWSEHRNEVCRFRT